MKMKHILNSPPIRILLCFLVSLYIRFIYLTTRWQRVIPQEVQNLIDEGKPIIFSFWHGRLLLAPNFTPRKLQNNVVISFDKDGQWIACVSGFL